MKSPSFLEWYRVLRPTNSGPCSGRIAMRSGWRARQPLGLRLQGSMAADWNQSLYMPINRLRLPRVQSNHPAGEKYCARPKRVFTTVPKFCPLNHFSIDKAGTRIPGAFA
jgi:hypothetical protein